jgi:tRNA (cmo5U34)-methyltransferase
MAFPNERSAQDGIDWNPDTYLDELRAAIPLYDEIQRASIDAIPFPPARVLELGVGTGETTRRLLARYPDAQLTGLDASPAMAFHARGLGIDVRLARMEDPLPDGPWDLVISVLAVHHLTDERKRGLLRRVREQARSFVLGDLVVVDEPTVEAEAGVDFPALAADQAEWCTGEVVWERGDFAVIRAVYEGEAR